MTAGGEASPLRVGLIGCGRIALSVHLAILTRLPGVQVVALAEPDPQRREEARRRAPRAAAFSEYQELLARPDVDAVVICAPNALHREVAVAALDRGRHVYLEKPLATNLRDAGKVLEAWRRAGVVGMIGFNYRFHALYQAARRHIQSGKLGELVAARSVFSSAAQTLPDWKQARQTGGGVLLDLASHHVDLVRFLFAQNVREVFASLRSQRSEGDSAALQMRLAGGLLVQSFFSLSAAEGDRFEIYGQAGKLAMDRHLSFNLEIAGPSVQRSWWKRLGRGLRSAASGPYLLQRILSSAVEPSYRAALACFVDSARSGPPAGPDLGDGYRALEVIEAAEESARTGRVVSLPEGRP